MVDRATGGCARHRPLSAAGVPPAGQWVQIEALLTADWQADTTRFLVESAEYDVENGRWVLQPKEAANPFDLGTEQG